MAPKKNDPRDPRAKKDIAKKDEKPMRPMAGAPKRQPPAPVRNDDRFGEEE